MLLVAGVETPLEVVEGMLLVVVGEKPLEVVVGMPLVAVEEKPLEVVGVEKPSVVVGAMGSPYCKLLESLPGYR